MLWIKRSQKICVKRYILLIFSRFDFIFLLFQQLAWVNDAFSCTITHTSQSQNDGPRYEDLPSDEDDDDQVLYVHPPSSYVMVNYLFR